MDSTDLRTLTSFGERLLADHQGTFRKELQERFAKIADKVASAEHLTAEQKSVVETFRFTGRTIIEKSAVNYPG
jgi:hypothetical protein